MTYINPTYTTAAGVAIPDGKPYNRALGVFNMTSRNMGGWLQAIGKARNGTAQARMALVGDSTVFGNSGSTPQSVYSPAGQLQSHYASLFGPVGTGFVGHYDADGTGDTRVVTVGSGMSVAAGYGFPSAKGFTSGKSITFTAPAEVDTLTAYVMGYPNGGTDCKISVDGVVVDTFSNVVGGDGAVITKTRTVTPGSPHTIKFDAPTTGVGWFLGFSSRLAASNTGVLVHRFGGSGLTATAFAATDASGLPPLPFTATAVGADLWILHEGINADASLAAFATAATAQVAAYKATGASVILETPFPVGTTTDPTKPTFGSTGYLSLVQKLYDLAASLDVPLIDYSDRWNLNYLATTASFGANVHPNLGGYSDSAVTIRRALESIG